MEKEPYDLEDVYDEKIAPLMDQIIAVCKEHKLPMVASFQYMGDDLCTTALLFEEREICHELEAAFQAVKPQRRPPPLNKITLTKADGSKEITVIL